MAWLVRYQYLLLAGAALLLALGLIAREVLAEDPPALVVSRADTTVDGMVVVHVAGAVAAPGVYELPAGARVQDAVLAAGGALPTADLSTVNLARLLRDQEKVTLFGATQRPSTEEAPGPLVDINRASAAELIELPGIGEAYSRRIIDSRTVDGPFESVDELVTRRVVPASTLAGIRDRVTVSP
jgi:competence protein ComEA